MSIGGKVIQVHFFYENDKSKVWVNTLDDGGEHCAVVLDGTRNVRLEDTVWWQGGVARWSRTKQQDEFDMTFTDEPVGKLSCSGVEHPLGKEYRIVYDFHEAHTKQKTKIKALENEIELLKEDIECVHIYFDNEGIPSHNNEGYKYSMIGRIDLYKGESNVN